MEEWTLGKQRIRATGTKNDKILVLREVDKKSVLIEYAPPAVYGQRPRAKTATCPGRLPLLIRMEVEGV
ncbi:MAG: hypothetical protein AVDCRST_MAG56-758 [uncultured Cytophagales bacterium]|uniref:Uncharacterized protein n=1 Tax=uncultured Cytophagales bacterium TaxID=158755 RepID=A0A6J4HLM7_9SPHI|nr:MAG: hypothetical protein AVDCRST_MAG56-758 [uncultured Cytophagales bacterium]